MVLTVPQAQTLGREHGRIRAERAYSSNYPFAGMPLLARAETRRALLWMAVHAPFPSFLHKDAYAREFLEEFYRYWQYQRKTESKHVRRRLAASHTI